MALPNVSYHNVTHTSIFYHNVTHDSASYHHVSHENVSYHNATDTSTTFTSLIAESIALKSVIFILGILTVLVNLITVVVVFTSSNLKRHSTIFLAGHIAVCDFFIGLFLLVVAVLAFDYEQKRYIVSSKTFVCPVTIALRSSAFIVEPLLLFIMTLDRYIRIVHRSKPPLSRRFITLTAFFSWFMAIIIASVGSVDFFRGVSFGNLCARADISRQSIDAYIERALIASSTLLFVTCCFMYFRIYRVVKSQNQRMGTRAYVRVCKLIFALVLSTMVLWYVPSIAVAFIGRQNNASREIRGLIILIAFTTNSLVNPFLYILREKKFRQEICPSCKCRTIQRRKNTTGPKRSSFKVYEIAMAVVNHDQTSSNSCNSDETQETYTTAL